MNNIIFGHSWEAIQRAQQGGRLHDAIDTSKPVPTVQVTETELALFRDIGLAGLESKRYFGLIDRLKRLNLI